MSLIAAAQWTAVATIVLAAFAIVTAWYARRAFRGQSEELQTLKDQLKDQQDLNAKQAPVLVLQAAELQESLAERKREAEERRRAQAAGVYITADVLPGNKAHPGNEYIAGRSARPPVVVAIVHNTGDRPVYDLRIHWMALTTGSQTGAEDQRGTLGPQADIRSLDSVERKVPDDVAADQFIPVAYFRDAAGLRWTLTPNGVLAPVDAELKTGAPLIATRAAARAYPNAG